MNVRAAYGLAILFIVLSSVAVSYPITGSGGGVSVAYSCSKSACGNNTLKVELESESSIQTAIQTLRPLLGSLARFIPSEGVRCKVLDFLELPDISGARIPSDVLIDSIQVADAGGKIRFDLKDEGLGYVIEFAGEPIAVYQSHSGGGKTAEASAAYASSLAEERRQALAAITAVAPGIKVKYAYSKVFNGVAVTARKEDLPAIASIKSVKRIYPIRKVHALLNESVPLINADDVWLLNDSQGLNVTGRNKTIAVIDTGVDYTHPDVGGCTRFLNGTVANYSLESEHPYNDSVDLRWTITRTGYSSISLHFSEIETESGYDFVYVLNSSNQTVASYSGDRMDLWTTNISGDTVTVRLVSDDSYAYWGFAIDQIANGSVTVGLPQNCSKLVGGFDFVNNDSDPMDDNGHGTHCAAIAAGNGTLLGVAPGATVYAYKVLDSSGSGSTADIVAGIDAAADPNGDNNTQDHVDVISMSLGGDGSPDDSMSTAVDNAVDAGVVVVVAAGNSGPDNKTIGSPGCARKALTVGASYKSNTSSGRTQSKLFVASDNNTELPSLGFEFSNTTPDGGMAKRILFADLGYSQNFTSQNFTDKIALIRRGEINFTAKVANARAAGAVGVVIYNSDQGNFYGTLGNTSAIPAVSVSDTNGTYLLNLINANATYVNLSVTADSTMLADFSSRGPALIYSKPDVIAPGVLICAAQHDSFENDSSCLDSRHIAISGTSMATPHVAGAAALILQTHPDWSPLEVKAALENTARDVGLSRNEQGAGLIDAYAAVNLARPPPVSLITDVEGVVYEYD